MKMNSPEEGTYRSNNHSKRNEINLKASDMSLLAIYTFGEKS